MDSSLSTFQRAAVLSLLIADFGRKPYLAGHEAATSPGKLAACTIHEFSVR
jgi:hypothetical protein